MDWQPRTYKEVIEEFPYVPLVLILDTVVSNSKKGSKESDSPVDLDRSVSLVQNRVQNRFETNDVPWE